MKKYVVGVVGFFGNGISKAGGQEAKTYTITKALLEKYGETQVATADTKDWKKHAFKLLGKVISLAKTCENVIMLPAQNAVYVFIPLFVFLRRFYGCRVHYAVVGGWLPKVTEENRMLAQCAKKLDSVLVETKAMKEALVQQGFNNVAVLPNFKYITPLKESDLPQTYAKPYRLCMFSRVMKEKGIEDAVAAVKAANEKIGKVMLRLDVYGKIDPDYEDRFANLQKDFPRFIRYCGMVEPEESVTVLKDYFALLFPTYYDGEGFAGTLLDALAAGVPVIVSDWKYNREIIEEGKTGMLFPARDIDALTNKLIYIIENAQKWNNMRHACLEETKKYHPSEAMKPLFDAVMLPKQQEKYKTESY